MRRFVVVVAFAATALVAAPQVSAGESDSGPEAFEPVPMVVQTAAGTGVVGASFAGADRVFSHAGFSPTSVGIAMGLVSSMPLTVPLAVNLTGSAFGYDTQWLGSHLGGLAGGLGAGLGTVGIGAAASDQSWEYFLGWGLLGMGAGAVLGSLMGFHLRAGGDGEASAASGATPVVAPTLEQATGDWGVTAGWQGRF